MSSPLLPGTWQAADNRSVRSHRRLVEAINQIGTPVPGSPGVSVQSTPHGHAVGVPDRRDWLELRPAILVNAGPAGESDFTNSRYWFKLAEVNVGNANVLLDFTATVATTHTDTGIAQEPLIQMVTNLAEKTTHLLPVDGTTKVMVFGLTDPNGNRRWWMYVAGPGRLTRVKAQEERSNATTIGIRDTMPVKKVDTLNSEIGPAFNVTIYGPYHAGDYLYVAQVEGKLENDGWVEVVREPIYPDGLKLSWRLGTIGGARGRTDCGLVIDGQGRAIAVADFTVTPNWWSPHFGVADLV